MSTTNTPEYVTDAIKRAESVDKSHKGHHDALMRMVAACAQMDIADAIGVIQLYADNRLDKSPNSLCTKSTFLWMNECFGIYVNEQSGKVGRGREFAKRGFNDATFEKARANPWYDMVKALAFKKPVPINLKSTAIQAIKLAHMGEDMPTKDVLWAIFTDALIEIKNSKKTLSNLEGWCTEFDTRKAAGEFESTETGEPSEVAKLISDVA